MAFKALYCSYVTVLVINVIIVNNFVDNINIVTMAFKYFAGYM